MMYFSSWEARNSELFCWGWLCLRPNQKYFYNTRKLSEKQNDVFLFNAIWNWFVLEPKQATPTYDDGRSLLLFDNLHSMSPFKCVLIILSGICNFMELCLLALWCRLFCPQFFYRWGTSKYYWILKPFCVKNKNKMINFDDLYVSFWGTPKVYSRWPNPLHGMFIPKYHTKSIWTN